MRGTIHLGSLAMITLIIVLGVIMLGSPPRSMRLMIRLYSVKGQ